MGGPPETPAASGVASRYSRLLHNITTNTNSFQTLRGVPHLIGSDDLLHLRSAKEMLDDARRIGRSFLIRCRCHLGKKEEIHHLNSWVPHAFAN